MLSILLIMGGLGLIYISLLGVKATPRDYNKTLLGSFRAISKILKGR